MLLILLGSTLCVMQNRLLVELSMAAAAASVQPAVASAADVSTVNVAGCSVT